MCWMVKRKRVNGGEVERKAENVGALWLGSTVDLAVHFAL